MSDQEMSLEQAIGCFRLVQNFEEYKEGLGQVLTRCHTQEELDKAKAVIEVEKTRLLETNEEFKAIMDRRKVEAKMRADESIAVHRAKMAQSKAEASRARTDAMFKARSGMSEPDLQEWVAKTRIKKITPEEAQQVLDDKLGCPNPKCEDHGKNRRNVMNDVETCMLCYHRLVPKSKFKDHNRRYWRKFNRMRKKKRK